MEQFDSSEEESSRVLEQQHRNDEQQCPSCAAELAETLKTIGLSVFAELLCLAADGNSVR